MRTVYPKYIDDLKNDERSIFYVISKEPGYYKFGITFALRNRMKSHYRDFQFTRIDAIIDCGYDSVMRAVETEFKQESAKRGILITRYDKTEVIAVLDAAPFIHWVTLRVAEMLKQPQPANNRPAARKAKKIQEQNSHEIELYRRLHEQDQQEIKVLRDKIAILEEIVGRTHNHAFTK